ncbi:gas vesicle protein GvpN [Falsibacillus pallidus]|uniref:Gas vesicle protein GvpN n=1 Tax=Falsibacillus pallidus TaxID=493781 RepID=A0A370GQH6_9BACI|nr:gas vesicle protein GvpN [Falsibacillus pallidus]RDI45975.1 gas vesicle protein GvpN [Falsibacillus pallidus]
MTVLQNREKAHGKTMVQDEVSEDTLSRTLEYLRAGYPVHFSGPAGTGKTTTALALAKKRKRPVMIIHGNPELNNKDMIGDFTGYSSKKVVDQYVRSVYKKEEHVTESWRDGRLLEAVKNGWTLIYDEFTRSKPSANNLFLSVIEEGILPLYGTKQTEPFIRVHPDFRMIFTSNPLEYAGVYKTQDALLDRMITIQMNYLNEDREAIIIAKKTGLEKDEIKMITGLVSRLREKCSNENGTGPSIRASLMIAELAKRQDIEIDGDHQDFQRLCLDVLEFPIKRLSGETEPEKWIMKELKNLSK